MKQTISISKSKHKNQILECWGAVFKKSNQSEISKRQTMKELKIHLDWGKLRSLQKAPAPAIYITPTHVKREAFKRNGFTRMYRYHNSRKSFV